MHRPNTHAHVLGGRGGLTHTSPLTLTPPSPYSLSFYSLPLSLSPSSIFAAVVAIEHSATLTSHAKVGSAVGQVHPSKLQGLKQELVAAVRKADIARTAAVAKRFGAEQAAVAAEFSTVPASRRASPPQSAATPARAAPPPRTRTAPATRAAPTAPPPTAADHANAEAHARKAYDTTMLHVAKLREVGFAVVLCCNARSCLHSRSTRRKLHAEI